MSSIDASGDAVSDVVTLGETMALMRAEGEGSLAHVSRMAVGIGGAESNVAVALRRLGTSVTWVGRIGADSLGERVARELRAEGVDVVAIVDDGAPTGLMLKERRTNVTTRVLYYRARSAGSRLAPEDVPVERIRRARVLHLTGITPALSSTAAAAADHAIDVARAAGVTVSFDLNHRAALWGPDEAGPVFRSLISRADVVFGGDDELALAVGPGDPEALARRVVELGPSHAVVKLGAAGCLALVDGELLDRAAVPIVPRDTVGAGDAFVAGYLAELLAGAPLAQRLDTAVRTGAFACLVEGDWEGMPRRDELGLLDAADPVQR